MTHSLSSTSGWLTRYKCFRFSLLYIIHISAFHYFFAGARPAPSNPIPCKERPVEGVLYMLDTDNHLVQRFLGTECHTEEIDFISSESKLPLLQQVSHNEKPEDSDMHQLPVVSAERRPTTLGSDFGEEVSLLSTMSHPDQWQVVRRGIDGGPLLESNNHFVLAVPLESAGGITTDTYTSSVDNPSFVWSTTTVKPTDMIEQTSDQKLMPGDFNSLVVSSNETLASPSGFHNSSAFSKDFNYVVGMAVVLGFSMAMPALILICALSKKGKFIWIRTVSFTGAQPPSVEHGYYGGAANISSGYGSESTNRSGIALSDDIDRTNRSSSQDIERISRSGTVSHPENLNSSSIASRNNTESAGRSEVTTRHDIESANRSVVSVNRPGGFQRWFGSTGSSSVRNPGVFQRWFGWGSAKRVDCEENPSSTSTRQGRKIHSARTRTRDGTPDISLILTEVSERLARGRMGQLSTVFSVGEEEESQSNIVLAREEEELSPVPSTRAVATGSIMGTQRQNSTVKRNRQGVLKTFRNMDGVGVTAGCAIAGANNTREESQEDEPENSEGSDLREEASRSVRFDDSTDKGKAKARGTFRRVSIRQYLFPTVEDDKPSTGEASPSENNVFEMSSETVVRNEGGGERPNDLWEKMFGDPVALSTDSTISGGTGTKQEGQPKRGCESRNCISGSSIGGDSTLTVSSDGGVKLIKANNRLSIEGHRPGSEDTVQLSGLGMSGDPVLNQFFRTQSAMDVTTEGVVSAFGIGAKPPRWGGQTSSEGSQNSGYFTGSSTGHENEMGSDTSALVDHMKGAGTGGEKRMHGELNGQP